jgi:VWFA-related protein
MISAFSPRSGLIAAVVASCLLGAAPAAQRTPPAASSGDLVELDVVALDRQGQPVAGLRQEEFQIKEDGRVVDIKTFAHVITLGSAQPDDARVVTLLLDDIGVPMTGTYPMRGIAQAMLSPAGRGDEVSVVRLSSRSDEAFGDYQTARDRIDGYHGGVVPFSNRDTPETVLKMVAKIARQLEAVEHRRKVILCVGLPVVCDVPEPAFGQVNPLWPHWVGALNAAARANASVYAVDATGLSRGSGAHGTGLVAMTGGELFANSNDFLRAADAIWSRASRYYLLGYWPLANTRELHSIDVKVARKDVRLHVRRTR